MTYPIEIMLRGDERVYTDSLVHDGEAAGWSDRDVQQVLEKMLGAVGRVVSPGRTEPVALRGLSWIVSPYEGGVVIALEVHSASAVAGPFPVAQDVLNASIERVLNGVPPSTTVH
ncbi:MAG: hypothetical protein KJ061_08785 [Vicinamibacteraceae bacterium]|nr:hypothetical protein [Vicinamibacteraceae bacterium]